ncbi:MAG TPA: Dyp-type peroxidase [Pilimelia sp.]|nr:Dyp-type peroxidase [Pilimelia sp.]
MTSGLTGRALSRRTLLAGAVAPAGAVVGGGLAGDPVTPPTGPHQPGIVTAQLPYLSLAGFDVVAPGRDALAALLRTWTALAEGLMAAGGCTVTVGFGPALFAPGRYGLAGRRPAALVPLPPFRGEALDPAAGGGDLCVQACAGTPTAAHQAVRTLLNATRPLAALRWRQTGFVAQDGTTDPRNLFGFRDGTANLDVRDPAETAAHLWVDDGPEWLHGGTYLVARRIRLLLDTWDRMPVGDQEATIGRRRDSNRRFAAGPAAHAPLASPERNGGAKLLRRPYSYDAGVDPNGLMDAGLIFICFQRDPGRQFVPIQRRLAASDALNAFSQHRASGVFACPPRQATGSWLGAELLS